MAAIDKMYVNSYYEYDDLKRWAITYYPELLFYFYDIALNYKQFDINREQWIKKQIDTSKKEYERKIGTATTKEEAVSHIRNLYQNVGYDCPLKQAKEEYEVIVRNYARTAGEWEDIYEFPIMNTPLKVDRKLLWICPIPCVRKYLEEHCGYKTRWYHKLFWRGKKHF